jgi:hypothetical protein
LPARLRTDRLVHAFNVRVPVRVRVRVRV